MRLSNPQLFGYIDYMLFYTGDMLHVRAENLHTINYNHRSLGDIPCVIPKHFHIASSINLSSANKFFVIDGACRTFFKVKERAILKLSLHTPAPNMKHS